MPNYLSRSLWLTFRIDYVGNEQETQRNPSENDDGQTIEAVSSNIDDQTMHEIYVWYVWPCKRISVPNAC